MSLSKRQRFAILERDDFACRYCGRRAPDVETEMQLANARDLIADLELTIERLRDDAGRHVPAYASDILRRMA